MSLEKGFFVKNMKDKTLHDIIVKWNEFIELLKIEQDESQKESQRGLNHALTNFEGSSGPCLTKKKKKEKTEGEKKQKILKKLVVEKEDKGFNVAKCQLIDNTLGNEFLGCFLFANDSLLGVSIHVHHFKKTTPNIGYRPL